MQRAYEEGKDRSQTIQSLKRRVIPSRCHGFPRIALRRSPRAGYQLVDPSTKPPHSEDNDHPLPALDFFWPVGCPPAPMHIRPQ
jgi:hypothetical protein